MTNYTNLRKDIHENTEYLEKFLRNLLLGEKKKLNNRNLHINGFFNIRKVDIGDERVDMIQSFLASKSPLSERTLIHVHKMFNEFGYDDIFGRSAVMELLELKKFGASKLISKLVKVNIIESVSGYGKESR